MFDEKGVFHIPELLARQAAGVADTAARAALWQAVDQHETSPYITDITIRQNRCLEALRTTMLDIDKKLEKKQ